MSSKTSPKRILKREEQPVRKQFTYELEGVQLSFTLRIDIKKELKAFKDLMVAADKDITSELEKLGK